MEIKVGFELIYDCPQPTPMMLVLNVHYSRASDLVVPDHLTTNPTIPLSAYRDGFGNWCTRLVAPPGRLTIASTAVVRDSGCPEIAPPYAYQHSIEELPEEALVFLLGSRYCDTEKLSDVAWRLFGRGPVSSRSIWRSGTGEPVKIADSLAERERFELSVLVCVFQTTSARANFRTD